MEIVLRPSIIFPIGVCFVFLIVFLQVYKDWSNGKLVRNFSIIVVCIVFILVFSLSVLQKTRINISESGIKISGDLKVFIPWNDIKSVDYLKDYKNSGYNPESRLWGSNSPGYDVGFAELTNKKKAYRILSGYSSDAIVIDSERGLYLFSLKNSARVFKEISRYNKKDY